MCRTGNPLLQSDRDDDQALRRRAGGQSIRLASERARPCLGCAVNSTGDPRTTGGIATAALMERHRALQSANRVGMRLLTFKRSRRPILQSERLTLHEHLPMPLQTAVQLEIRVLDLNHSSMRRLFARGGRMNQKRAHQHDITCRNFARHDL